MQSNLQKMCGKCAGTGLPAVNPLNPQTWNRYAYVSNSPLNAIDPTGLNPNGVACRGANEGSANCIRYSADCTQGAGFCPPPPLNGTTLDLLMSRIPVVERQWIGPYGYWRYWNAYTESGMYGDLVTVRGHYGDVFVGFMDAIAANNDTFLGWDANAWRAFRSSLFSWKNFSAGFKEGGCFSQFAEEAFDPEDSMGLQDQAIKASAQSGAYVAATAYAVNQGLAVPMRSSIVRGILDVGETAGESAAIGATVYSEGKALVNEVNSFKNGQCQ